MTRLLIANRYFFLPYLILFLTVSVLMLFYTKDDMMHWVNGHYNEAADFFFSNITNLGDGAFFVIVIVVLAFRSFRYAAMGLASFALSTLIAQGLKHLAFPNSLRPVKFFEHSEWEYRVIKGLQIHSYNSFPSGHSTSAFAVFCLLALLDERKERGWLFVLLAALVAYSRVYLFQHFVEDVFVGSLIGVLSSLVVFLFLSHRWERVPRSWHKRRLRFR